MTYVHTHKRITAKSIKAKPASELGLTDSEFAALIKTRNLLSKHAAASKFNSTFGASQFDGIGIFNMQYPAKHQERYHRLEDGSEQYECTTAACIAGWMKLQEADIVTDGKRVLVSDQLSSDISKYVRKFHWNEPLHTSDLGRLFYPSVIREGAWNQITPAHAVLAIDAFLHTGKPDWSQAVADINAPPSE